MMMVWFAFVGGCAAYTHMAVPLCVLTVPLCVWGVPRGAWCVWHTLASSVGLLTLAATTHRTARGTEAKRVSEAASHAAQEEEFCAAKPGLGT